MAAVPAAEKAYLVDLYNSTDGANWSYSYGWLTGDPCDDGWSGLGCSGPDINGFNHVVDIYLSSNNLVGTVPANLGALPELVYFQVQNNQLTGSLPDFTGAANLYYVNVENNQFTGSIPTFSGLTNLSDFIADNNQLSGSIPALTGLTNLYAFSVSNNQLTGSIPDFTGTDMGWFVADNNQLTGSIPSLTAYPNLREFIVNDNLLTGSVPDLTNLSSLMEFHAYNNQLDGTIGDLSGLSSVRIFRVENNQLTGSIPDLSDMTSLRIFRASDNQLTGAIPTISTLSELRAFIVSNNELTGTIPDISGLSNLINFFVSNNQLTGNLPDISGLTNLQKLRVAFNQLDGNLSSAPSGLLASQSTLCPNNLTNTADSDWDTATGETPWYSDCKAAPIDPTMPISPINATGLSSDAYYDSQGFNPLTGTFSEDGYYDTTAQGLPVLHTSTPQPRSLFTGSTLETILLNGVRYTDASGTGEQYSIGLMGSPVGTRVYNQAGTLITTNYDAFSLELNTSTCKNIAAVTVDFDLSLSAVRSTTEPVSGTAPTGVYYYDAVAPMVEIKLFDEQNIDINFNTELRSTIVTGTRSATAQPFELEWSHHSITLPLTESELPSGTALLTISGAGSAQPFENSYVALDNVQVYLNTTASACGAITSGETNAIPATNIMTLLMLMLSMISVVGWLFFWERKE